MYGPEHPTVLTERGRVELVIIISSSSSSLATAPHAPHTIVSEERV